jgi:hypothetical protein
MEPTLRKVADPEQARVERRDANAAPRTPTRLVREFPDGSIASSASSQALGPKPPRDSIARRAGVAVALSLLAAVVVFMFNPARPHPSTPARDTPAQATPAAPEQITNPALLPPEHAVSASPTDSVQAALPPTAAAVPRTASSSLSAATSPAAAAAAASHATRAPQAEAHAPGLAGHTPAPAAHAPAAAAHAHRLAASAVNNAALQVSDGVPPSAASPAPSPEPAPAAVKAAAPDSRPGYLSLDSAPWSDVFLGAERLGTTPLMHVPLPPGKHILTLKNPELGTTTSYMVEIESGKNISRLVGWERR